jgi:hypothetical protein
MSRKVLTDSFALSASLEKAKGNNNNQLQKPLFKGILYEKFDDGFGNPVLHKIGENTVVVGGAIQSLEHLCHVTANWKPKTLNEIYGINTDTAGNNLNSRIALFGVGTGGSGLEFGSITEKDVKRRDIPDLIPLRSAAALTGDDADLYYFKKAKGDGTYDWYLKEFAVDPLLKHVGKMPLTMNLMVLK